MILGKNCFPNSKSFCVFGLFGQWGIPPSPGCRVHPAPCPNHLSPPYLKEDLKPLPQPLAILARGLKLITREDPLHQSFGMALEPLSLRDSPCFFSNGALPQTPVSRDVSLRKHSWTSQASIARYRTVLHVSRDVSLRKHSARGGIYRMYYYRNLLRFLYLVSETS